MPVNAVHIELVGADELRARLMAAGLQAIPTVAKALYADAQVTFAESQKEVPVATSALKGSGQIHQPQASGRNVEVSITYGGPAAPYAIYVHEIKDNYHAPPTKAKFLYDPVMRAAQRIPATVGAEIRRLLGG